MGELIWLSSLSDYEAYNASTRELKLYKARVIDLLLSGWRRKKTLPGYSVPADRMVDFHIDDRLRLPNGGINLRETVNCPKTGFNMRMRAAIHAFNHYEKDDELPIYINEQKTPLFKYFSERLPNLMGSEYLGDKVALGAFDSDGLRNEDATQLTFEDNSFGNVMSFEVLEHIPDYMAALRETYRVLRPGGRFYFTAPFNPHVNEHLIRAKIENGEIVHILEPEIHGDPVNDEGILCFQQFGWEIVEELHSVGFTSVEALVFDQIEFGYYTQDPILVFRAVAQ